MIDIVTFLNQIDNIMYFPILIIVMAAAGLYFTARTRGVQIRLLVESIRLLMEPAGKENSVSSLQAMLVSTASRVGTGNIIGVSTAICLGGPGACFWMWVMCIIGASSAFMESTLAQIYKRKDEHGESYGGPAYYIEEGLKQHKLAILFCIFLIATYALGFNLLCSYNLQSTFMEYSFYNPSYTPAHHRGASCHFDRILPHWRGQKDSEGYKYRRADYGSFLCHHSTDCNIIQLLQHSINVRFDIPGCL
ncbi:MAG: sodium:alanine symporter family protein [Methanobrevibacter sp.]|nr:sodium:alanine symporter family protein [Methanobrevibacter sp.]